MQCIVFGKEYNFLLFLKSLEFLKLKTENLTVTLRSTAITNTFGMLFFTLNLFAILRNKIVPILYPTKLIEKKSLHFTIFGRS